MTMKLIIECCVCGVKDIEAQAGDGFVGWGTLQGIVLNEEPNPDLCPEHLSELAYALDVISQGPAGLKAKGVL